MVRTRRRRLGWREVEDKKLKEEKSKDSDQEELKQKPMTDYLPSHQYTPSFHTGSESEGYIPVFTDMLVPAPEEEYNVKEEQDKEEDKNFETDYNSDDTIGILRSELIYRL